MKISNCCSAKVMTQVNPLIGLKCNKCGCNNFFHHTTSDKLFEGKFPCVLCAKCNNYEPTMTDDNKYIQNLNDIIQAAEGISGQWNGDNPGIAEDRAGIANEIIQKANEIKELINQL